MFGIEVCAPYFGFYFLLFVFLKHKYVLTYHMVIGPWKNLCELLSRLLFLFLCVLHVQPAELN
jgi:hypothetical protein